MIGPGYGPLGVPNSGWAPPDFGAAFILLAPPTGRPGNCVLAANGLDVLAIRDDAGGPIVLSAIKPGREAALNAAGAIRGRVPIDMGARTGASLRSATGGTGGADQPSYLATLVRMTQIAGAPAGLETLMLLGEAGNGPSTGIGSRSADSAYWFGGSGAVQNIGSGANTFSSTEPVWLERIYDGTNVRVYMNFDFISSTAESVTVDGAAFGHYAWFGDGTTSYKVQPGYIYTSVTKTNGIPSFADRIAMARHYPLGFFGHRVSDQFTGSGDSTTVGTGATAGVDDYLTEIGLLFAGAGLDVSINRQGVSSTRTDEITLKSVSTDFHERCTSPFARRRIQGWWGGLNDLNQNLTGISPGAVTPTTAAAMYEQAAIACAAAHARGNLFCISTLQDSGISSPGGVPGAKNTVRLAYNALVLGNGIKADIMADVSTAVGAYSVGAPRWDVDAIHLSPAGQLIAATTVFNAIRAAFPAFGT